MHINPKLVKIARWISLAIIIKLLIAVVAYNLIFQSYEVIGESIQCDTNLPIAVNYSCKLDIIDNNTQYWSFESEIPANFQIPNMMARITTFHWNNGEYKAVFFKNTTLDVCKYSGGQFSKLFVSVFLPDMLETSNLNQPCPFTGTLFMRKFQFRHSLPLPRIVPGKWMLDIKFFVPEFEELYFTMKILFEVKPIGYHLFEFELS